MYVTDNNYYPITLDLLRVPCNYNNDHHYTIRENNQNAARYARPSWNLEHRTFNLVQHSTHLYMFISNQMHMYIYIYMYSFRPPHGPQPYE